MGRVGDEDRRVQPAIAHQDGDGPERAQGVARLVLAEDRRGRDAVGDGVLAGHGGLRGPVARDPTAGDDEGARRAQVPQVDRVVQAGGEHGRRAAVVLGRTEHHDGVGRAPLVLVAHLPDPERRGDPGQQERGDRGDEQPEQVPRAASRQAP